MPENIIVEVEGGMVTAVHGLCFEDSFFVLDWDLEEDKMLAALGLDDEQIEAILSRHLNDGEDLRDLVDEIINQITSA